MLNTVGHNAQLCMLCTILTFCSIHFLNNNAQLIVHVLYIKRHFLHKCIIAQQTCTIKTNHVLCLELCRFVVLSCAWVLSITCKCCALCICTNTTSWSLLYNLLILAEFSPIFFFFCTAILHPLLEKVGAKRRLNGT